MSRAAAVLCVFWLGCSPAPERSFDAAPERPARGPRPPPAPVIVETARAEVAIVGGGLAGLVTAHALGKRGISTHVLEASPVWGGRVATAHYAPDLSAEYGMQEIWGTNPLLGIARELGVELDGSEEPPFSSVLLDGRVFPYVQDTTDQYFGTFLTPAELRTLRRWLARAWQLHQRARRKGLADREIRRLQDLSFADWIAEARLAPRAAELVRLTIECELAADWQRFSALIGLIELEVFLGPGVSNHHVRGGNQRLIEALARSPGGKTLSATATRVVRERDASGRVQATVEYLTSDHRLHRLIADRVVLAVPFVRLHQIVTEPALSREKIDALASLGRGQYIVVHLLVDRAATPLWQLGEDSPFPVLSRGPLGVIYGVQEEPPASQPLQVFSLLVYGEEARAFHMAPRERKMAEVRRELDALWPGLSRHVRASYVYEYHPASIATWPPGRSPLDEEAAALRAPELGLYLAGDYTWSAHAEGAARSGLAVADAIAAELRPPGARGPAAAPDRVP